MKFATWNCRLKRFVPKVIGLFSVTIDNNWYLKVHLGTTQAKKGKEKAECRGKDMHSYWLRRVMICCDWLRGITVLRYDWLRHLLPFMLIIMQSHFSRSSLYRTWIGIGCYMIDFHPDLTECSFLLFMIGCSAMKKTYNWVVLDCKCLWQTHFHP